MKEKVIKIVSLFAVGYSVASIGYTWLPQEVLDMLPQVNEAIAWVTGGSSGLLGLGLMYVDSKLKKNTQVNDEKVENAVKISLQLKNSYDDLKNDYKSLKGAYVELKEEIKRNTKINEAALNLKLSNKFIDAQAKELVKKVLDNEA